MDVTETKAEGLKRAYKATATATEIETLIDAKIDEVRPTLQLNGFRKGKAPRDLLKKMYGEGMRGEVMQQLVDDTLRGHLEQNGHRPAAQPEIKLLNETFDKGDDLNVEFSYEVMPEIPAVEFKEVSLERPVVAVSDDALKEALETLASNAKDFETKDGPSENGDQVLIDFVGRIDGEPFEGGAADDFPLELGGGRFIPGFEDQLVGAAAGDARDVEVTFPEDYGAAELAGKPAVFSVTVKEVKAAKAAEIDDALAERFGAQNLEDLRGKLTERLSNEYKSAARALMKRHLLDDLAGRVTFETPSAMTDGEAKDIARQLWHEENADAEGEDGSQIEPTDEHRALASRRVRLGLLLADIGAKNEIKLSDAEIANAAAQQASQYPGQEKQIYDFIMKDPATKERIAAPLYEDKVVDYVFELAQVTDKEMSFDDLKAALDALENEKT